MLPRARQQRAPGGGEVHALLPALEELETELALEARDGAAQGRLGHVGAGGRARERQLLGRGHEVAQGVELHAPRS